MAASGDVTIAQDGGPGNVKLHPYLVALVRWCVSCLWSTATVLLHRLITAHLPIAASRPWKPRPAGKEHLDPEPRVECVVLHQPAVHTVDVIFVHGLYGSLCNTWRQGEWMIKYDTEPEKVQLRNNTSLSPANCYTCDNEADIHTIEDNFNDDDKGNIFNDYENITDNAFRNINEKFYKEIKRILPNDDKFTTERFYNNTLLDHVEVVDNYDTQAKFVSDLFKHSNCDNDCDSTHNICNNDVANSERNEVTCKCKDVKQCEVGCGCICDECYSPCWPKDWIKVDHPGARVISINYTSDPYLWRPLWIKGNKRLCLHERAEQMTQQLLDLGVGQRPVVWVGHSKGGLFIKQIYCEAYEAHLKTTNKSERNKTEQNMDECNKDNEINNLNDTETILVPTELLNNSVFNNNVRVNSYDSKHNAIELEVEENVVMNTYGRNRSESTNDSESRRHELSTRAQLWSSSAGFMFYSVPHRGSPLAAIKTPVTARSIELLEITKDCTLVLTLQERWLRAAAPARPLVRSLVETRRTLMSVLWLRIVSADSADPGIGALCGVSVDHREICKPSSRRCLLYTELATLIRAALNKCRCQ